MEVGLSIPLGVDIEFNEACNASCVICPVSINPRRKNKFMSEQDSDLLFKKLSEYQNLRFLSFSIFNEPLLDPLFKTRIKQLRKYNLYDILNFHTNGTILNKDVTDFLKDGDMQMVQFNFPSMYETEWSEYMGMHKRREIQTVMNDALNSTLSRTINTSMTTFFVLLVIFIFGGEVIRGFMFALMVGVLVGTYSSLFVASPIMLDTLKRKEEKN